MAWREAVRSGRRRQPGIVPGQIIKDIACPHHGNALYVFALDDREQACHLPALAAKMEAKASPERLFLKPRTPFPRAGRPLKLSSQCKGIANQRPSG